MNEKGYPVAHSLPKELRILIVLAAAALLGGLMIGFTSQRASAAPLPEAPFVNPCVSYYTGQVSHSSGDCPAGTYEVDLSSGYHTLCANYYTGKIFYRYAGKCNAGEYKIAVDGENEIWGCVKTWTGAVTWMWSSNSPCSGQAMLFDTGDEHCRGYANPLAADKFNVAPLC